MLVEASLQKRIELLISTALLLEYEDVLTRDEHLRGSDLSLAEVLELLDALCVIATKVTIRYLWRPQLSDPNDEMVLETAINGRADAIVTFNRADFLTAAKRFGLKVFTPREALEQVNLK